MKLILLLTTILFVSACGSIKPGDDDPGIVIPLKAEEAVKVIRQAMTNQKIAVVGGETTDDKLVGKLFSGETVYVWLVEENDHTRLRTLTVYESMGNENQQDRSWKLAKEIKLLLEAD